MTDSSNHQLSDFGFHSDPFAFPDAERMGTDVLEETFVAHPGFNEQVMDLSRSAVLLAPRGAGKTAGRRRLEVSLNGRRQQILSGQYAEGSPALIPLVVSYNNFEQIVDRLPNVGLRDHIDPLLAAVAKAIYGFFRQHLDHVMTADAVEREWWCAFLRHYMEGEDPEPWIQAGALGPDWRRTQPYGAPFRQGSTLTSILQDLQQHLAGMGIHSLYILVDGVDGYLQSQPPPNLEALIAPLLNALPLLSLPQVVWKFFLPSVLEKAVHNSAGYETGRLNLVLIQWDEPSLIAFLRQRLSWASDSQVLDIDPLCDQHLVSTIKVERELARMALRHERLGPPRALLHLGDQLLKSMR